MGRVQHGRDRLPCQGDRDRSGLRSGRSRAPQVSRAVRDRLFALHLLRPVRRSVSRRRDPHGQGSPRPAVPRPRAHVAFLGRAAALEAAERRREALSAQGRRSKGTAMIETVLLWVFAATALAAAALMLVIRHPMRVALALTATMLSLAGVYALLGVHVIAVFQILIYVGAVMVFMVYVIMLTDVRDRSYTLRFSKLLIPGALVALALAALLARVAADALPART